MCPPNSARTPGHWVGQAVAAPTPDIVAAELVIETLEKADKGAPDLLWQGIALDDPMAAMGRLGRLSYAAEQVLGKLDTRLGNCPSVALDGKPERCHSVVGAFSDTNLPSGLAVCAVATWRTLAEHAASEEERASWLNNLSVDLSASGEEAGALEAVRQAVEIRRRLAAANPARFEPDLAMSLGALSINLVPSGDKVGALDAVEEGIELLRPYVQHPHSGETAKTYEGLLHVKDFLDP